MDRHLHIVALDIPYPVTYGGRFEMFYKLPALHQQGIRITLHCFTNDVKEQPELNEYCDRVFYYRRKKGLRAISPLLPYIVGSRKSSELTTRLLADDHPILLEGVHCTSILNDRRFSNRKIVLRLHNAEFLYYRQLFFNSRSLFKRMYYLAESILLKRYESGIAGKVSVIMALTDKDAAIYRDVFHASGVATLPVFTGFDEVQTETGSGSYGLYHGNLSVAENESAAMWLIGKVFDTLEIPLVIAGKDPSQRLIRRAKRYPHVTVIANPSADEMDDIIRMAQVHVLPSQGGTGIKLKLIHALYYGRHCLVNGSAVEGTGLAPLCRVAKDASAFKDLVSQLWKLPFTTLDIRDRQLRLSEIFDARRDTRSLIQWIW